MSATVTAQLQVQLAVQQQATTLNALLGNPDLPIEQYPPYQQAKAVLDQAERDLNHTTLKAPIAGTATQVDNIQLGRFVTAGTPILSVIDDTAPWVDANPKETDLTNVRVGQKVAIDVDAFPDHAFTGTVSSISPGTGAQFAILPPQNAIGNWVKVVQRVPVRIVFDPGQDVRLLRAGMSATVDIDTGHRRSIWSLFGSSGAASTGAQP
jgi:membrane fusion protein (multidrug efflux system)